MVVDKKIHEVISFKRSKWLEKYKNFNTQKRNQAVNDSEKDFKKTMNYLLIKTKKLLENLK